MQFSWLQQESFIQETTPPPESNKSCGNIDAAQYCLLQSPCPLLADHQTILDPQFFFGLGIWIQDVGWCCVRLSLSSSFTKCQSTRKLLIGINLSQTKGQVPKTAPHFLFFSIPVSHSLVLFSIQQQPLNPGLNGSPLLDHLKLFLCLECGTQCDPVVAASSKGHEEDERGRGKRRKKCRSRRKFDSTK